MKTHLRKITFLFGLYISLHYIAACDFTNCHCGHVDFPFFDYHALTVTPNAPATGNKLIMDVIPAETELVASVQQQQNHFNFITTASACDCIGNGDAGPKFSITSFNVFADRAFDDTHPVDSTLTALFTYSFYNGNSNLEVPLNFPFLNSTDLPLRLKTTYRPQNPEQPIRLTIQIVKSKNDTVSVQTDTLHFQ